MSIKELGGNFLPQRIVKKRAANFRIKMMMLIVQISLSKVNFQIVRVKNRIYGGKIFALSG